MRRFDRLFACLLLPFFLGCAHGLERGTEALEAEEYEEAMTIAQGELDDDADSPWANLLMAESLAATGEFRRALAFARRADQSESFPIRAPRVLAEIYTALGRPVDAAQAHLRIREIDASQVDDDTVIEALERALAFATARSDQENRWRILNWLAEVDPDHLEATEEQLAIARRGYAVYLRRRGEYQAAARLLEEALDGDPHLLNREALELGEIYARLDMEEEASYAWDRYLEADVDLEERLQRNHDVVYLANRYGYHDFAVEILSDLWDDIGGTYEHGELLFLLARHQLEAGQQTNAIESVREYLDLFTGDYAEGMAPAEPFGRVAALAQELDETRLAITVLERATEEARPNANITRQLAGIYARRAELSKVEDTLNRYIERHDDELEATGIAAAWALQRNNYELARHYYERLTELDGAPARAWHDLATALAGLDDESDAMIQAVYAYIEARGESDAALRSGAELFSQYRMYEQAERLLFRLRDRNPTSRDVTRRLARLYRDWSRPDEAVRVWETWIEERGNAVSDVASVARILYRAGDMEAASRLFTRAAEAGRVEFWLDAADIYLYQGHTTAMVRAIEQYVDSHDDRAWALQNAADRYRRARMEGRQIDVLIELVELRPDNWPHHERLAQLLIDQGRTDEAFEYLRAYVERTHDTVAALERIGSRISPRRQPSWMLEFYRTFADEDLGPEMDRLMGEAYYALSRQYAITPETQRHARRRARDHFLSYLDATEGEDHNWYQLANQWREQEMWRPAMIAFERYADSDGRSHQRSLSYAETLLHLGEVERALEVLELHFQHHRRRPDVANRTARLLIQFGLYDESEKFAEHLFITGDDSTTHEGYLLLADIRTQQEDFEGLVELSQEYLERSRNAHRARRSVASVLADAGRWNDAADVLDEFDHSVVYQFALEMGYHRYRGGDHDGAFDAFDDAASYANRPERTWLDAAQFLQSRGAIAEAFEALDRAVQANPDDLLVRAARAALMIHQDTVDEAWSEYQFCRASTAEFRRSHRLLFIEALFDSGYYDLARQVITDLERDGHTTPAEVDSLLGKLDLRSSNPAVSKRAMERIRAGSWGLHSTLESLIAVGRLDEVRELVEEEFEEGDPSRASLHLLSYGSEMSRLFGWEDAREMFRTIVDPLRRNDHRLLGAVGDHRLRSGQLDEARLYLQAAVDEQDRNYQPQLAHTLLLLGERDRAIDHFESWLIHGSAHSSDLESVLLRFELAGDPEAAVLLLHRLVDEPTLVGVALPYKIHYELERHGDPHRAIDEAIATVRSLQQLPATAFQADTSTRAMPGMSRDEILADALIGSLEAVASLGYVEAARHRLDDELPAARPHRLDHLRFKLALADGDMDTATEQTEQILSAVDGAHERQETRLELARTFLAFRGDVQARQLVEDALEEQTSYRGHGPFVLYLGMLVLAGEPDLLAPVRAYLDGVPDRRQARTVMIDELRRLGRDAEALALAVEAAEQTPTAQSINKAILSALEQGDEAQLTRWTDQLFQVADDPLQEMESLLRVSPTSRGVHSSLRGVEPSLLLPLVSRIREIRPASMAWILEEARLLFAAGEIERGRELVVITAESRNYDRDVVTELADMLAEEQLDVELARVLAPSIPDDALWPHLAALFAVANFALGLDEDAQSWLHRLDDLTDEPVLWRMEVAHRLARRHLFEAIGPVMSVEFDANRYGPFVEFMAALHSLATGEGDEGLARTRQANQRGMAIYHTHFMAIRAALHGDQPEAARALMEDMAALPTRDGHVASVPLQVVFSAARPVDGGPAAVRQFLEDKRPRLVDGHGATWTQFAGQLAMALENTGDVEGAYGFYRDRIWQSLLQRHDANLSIYFNNLAYTYSTTNQHIDQGVDHVLRAIVLRDERSPSFIDTLGWLLYRKGDLEAAEAEIRRALRSYQGPPSGLHELYYHLKVILRERGDYEQAVWIDVHLDRLPPETLDW